MYLLLGEINPRNNIYLPQLVNWHRCTYTCSSHTHKHTLTATYMDDCTQTIPLIWTHDLLFSIWVVLGVQHALIVLVHNTIDKSYQISTKWEKSPSQNMNNIYYGMQSAWAVTNTYTAMNKWLWTSERRNVDALDISLLNNNFFHFKGVWYTVCNHLEVMYI